MKFLDAEFVQGFIRMANDGWEQGWHERNGGNLSYRVKPEEVEAVRENFQEKEWQPIGTTVPNLAGEYFLVTGSGKYFRNVILKPEDSICIFTRELWEMATECPVVFPAGVGVVPWMVPGGREIAVATSELMKKYDLAIWAHHGMFAAGEDFDLTFGLMHTAEKSAEILVKTLSMRPDKLQTIQPDDFRHLAEDFHVTLPEEFLYEK